MPKGSKNNLLPFFNVFYIAFFTFFIKGVIFHLLRNFTKSYNNGIY